MSVKAWREMVTIPTYEVGKPEKNPMFLEKRVYQGSSGVVYPYPVIETMSDEKVDKDYLAIWIENEYVKIMVLPELGGRVQMAWDKIKKRHYVYYNHVIKPALVGLVGPWISGGIEFNWPQHHRPSTFMPVDTCIEENADGSVTVWVSEMEKMFHQKGMAGFTLRPGCAYLEIKGVLYNRTDVPQTFLWWANPAVEVNDAYQSVFPPDINAVFDHGKRAVSSFPIATGTYYKMDYSAGVDISNYKNIYVPTSYMGVNSRFNFEGGYENDTEAGMLHVASHHFSPGKKQWTWGNGDFGRAWDRNLTDETTPEEAKQWDIDRKGFRPYIELMAGVYTENQPDFTWLMPYEEKRFVQYFMPYRELGVVKQASKDLIMNIEESEAGVRFKVFATSKQEVRIVLKSDDGAIYYNKVLTITPEEVLTETVDVRGSKFNELTFDILKTFNYGERCVLQWHAESDDIRPIPDSAEAALLPEQIKTNEQLYLTGLHLEQYRHATWLPTDYYEEALRRDPNDIRCLNAMGLWYIRKGRFALAEEYLRKAVKLAQKRNPNPYDGEPIYNLALALKYQGKCEEAYELFWKATWNKGWADAGYFEAAKISVAQSRYEDALDEIDRCLQNNWHNHKARALKTAILRKLGMTAKALQLIDESLAFDQFNYGCWYEKYLLEQDEDILTEMKKMLRKSDQRSAFGTLCNAENYDEVALDYQAAGLIDEANAIWDIAIAEGAVTPMTYYYMGRYEEAMKTDLTYCFPNRPEAVVALEAAKVNNPKDGQAPYLLGCLFYAARQYDLAMQNWQRSADINPAFPTVWRNLALGTFNKLGEEEKALEMMERAFHLDENDERVLMELDQLYKRLHHTHTERLQFLQKYPQLILRRDDLVLEEITLLNEVGRYEEAMQKLDSHIFHPWEGGEGKVPTQYQIARVELAKRAILDKDYDRAIKLLNECLEYPHHLGEGKLYGAQENDFYYLLGVAYDAIGQKDRARECWEEATRGPQEPAAAMYYNDAKPDKIFYQGMALYKLGRSDEAHGRFYRLINYGKQHIFEKQMMDYFAVSLPDLLIWEDSLDTKNLIHCKYMLALGYYGMGDVEHAERYLAEVEALDNNHQGIQQFRTFISTNL
jgi:tetratricopeptide (TPR) repeat protein